MRLFDQSQGKPSKFNCLTEHLKSGVSYEFASYQTFAAALLAEENARGFALMPLEK